MKVIVTRPYERPYEKPIAVAAGDPVTPDFNRKTSIGGWVWCTARDGHAGWTPHAWIELSGNTWRMLRDFNALELSISIGELLDVQLEESSFYWAARESGETGWVPVEYVSPADRSRQEARATQ